MVLSDTLLILGAALLAVALAQLLGGTGSVSSSDGPSGPGDSEITVGDGGSVAVETLPPIATIGPAVNPSAGFGSSPTPVPFATLPPPSPTPSPSPTATPAPTRRPTPRPTLSPKPSPTHTSPPTAPPTAPPTPPPTPAPTDTPLAS